MDNPWATAWDEERLETPTALLSWSAADTDTDTDPSPPWPAPWVPDAQDQPRPSSPTTTAPLVSDHLTSPLRDPVPDASDAALQSISSEERLEAAPIHDWGVPWRTTPPSEATPTETQPPDQWEAARQEKEKLNRAVPPDLLDALLRHCQRVSLELWPAAEVDSKDDQSSGVDDLADIIVLLDQLILVDSTLPPSVQFSATSTAKAMNEALRLTRHLPASASSPLSRLLASKGSLEWEKSIKSKDAVPDAPHVGWRVLEKENRVGPIEESKPRKATSGLLSFWSRRASAIHSPSVDTPRERSKSPARSSLESVKSVPSPSKPSSPSVPPPPPPDSHPSVVAIAPAASAVSRFLNRFSRTKGAHHGSFALSSDDLEFLSDIVPSASDPSDEDINDGALDALTVQSRSSLLPPKLPPPTPPNSKQPPSPRLSSALGLGSLNGVSVNGNAPTALQMQDANHTPNVPVLDPPLSPKPAFPRTQTLSVSQKDVSTLGFGQSSISSMQHSLQPNSQPNPHSSTLPLPQRVPPSLSVPPLLPPPPVSPPQTPRPSAFSITRGISSAMRRIDTSSFHDSNDSDDEFAAFTSFPSPVPVRSPSSNSYPSGRTSPPSPPPRRTYERTHYPSSSSASSTLSPASQTSVDQLFSTSSISASLDSFGDFISPSSTVQGDNATSTPSSSPLPIKSQTQPMQPPRIDTLPSRVYHAHHPSQALTSPTAYTSLLNNTTSVLSVSNVEHQRTQNLVNHAAAHGGSLWPNSPGSIEWGEGPISLPPSSMSSKSLIEESFDLLGDGDLEETLPAPMSVVRSMGMNSTVLSRATGDLHVPFGVAGDQGKKLGLRSQLDPSPLPLSSTPISRPSSSSGDTLLPTRATNTRSIKSAKPKQTIGVLSPQDLSFFEGL